MLQQPLDIGCHRTTQRQGNSTPQQASTILVGMTALTSVAVLTMSQLLGCTQAMSTPSVLGVEARSDGVLVSLQNPVNDAHLLDTTTWTLSNGTVTAVRRSPDGHHYFLRTSKPLIGPSTITAQTKVGGISAIIKLQGNLSASNRPGPDFSASQHCADPKLNRTAPSEAVKLWTGHGTDNLVMKHTGGPVTWIQDGETLVVNPSEGDVVSRIPLGSGRYHIEWRSPGGGDSTTQSNGNSGVKFDSRYEIQILNTPGGDHQIKYNEAGSIYRVKAADHNASLGPDKWQTYDVWFTSPVWKDNTKLADARMTVFWNGVKVHDNVLIPHKTGVSIAEGPEPMPFLMQAHGSSAQGDVQFRNVWFVPADTLPPAMNPSNAP